MIKDSELKLIEGGSITATFISAIARCINSISDLGRSLGSSIRRIQTGSYCR
ncbi:MAG: hypothetical protein IJ715_03920 [Bacilli bacterium]|nr:hypothetical protein [Bacilli bacterium]